MVSNAMREVVSVIAVKDMVGEVSLKPARIANPLTTPARIQGCDKACRFFLAWASKGLEGRKFTKASKCHLLQSYK